MAFGAAGMVERRPPGAGPCRKGRGECPILLGLEGLDGQIIGVERPVGGRRIEGGRAYAGAP